MKIITLFILLVVSLSANARSKQETTSSDLKIRKVKICVKISKRIKGKKQKSIMKSCLRGKLSVINAENNDFPVHGYWFKENKNTMKVCQASFGYNKEIDFLKCERAAIHGQNLIRMDHKIAICSKLADKDFAGINEKKILLKLCAAGKFYTNPKNFGSSNVIEIQLIHPQSYSYKSLYFTKIRYNRKLKRVLISGRKSFNTYSLKVPEF